MGSCGEPRPAVATGSPAVTRAFSAPMSPPVPGEAAVATAGESADEVLQLAEQLRAPFREAAPPTISVAEWNRQ